MGVITFQVYLKGFVKIAFPRWKGFLIMPLKKDKE